MSRGPGKWQRQVLSATERGWCWLVDILEPGYTRAQYVALHRAATTLADAGRIDMLLYRFGAKTVAIGPSGDGRPRRCVDLDHRHSEAETCAGCG